jgi:hypothetical protein
LAVPVLQRCIMQQDALLDVDDSRAMMNSMQQGSIEQKAL